MTYEGSPAPGILIVLALFLLYFVPVFVAHHRQHHQRLAISVLTLFAGWTALGWLIALVWACTAVRPGLPPVAKPTASVYPSRSGTPHAFPLGVPSARSLEER